jgi:polysaccharide export outer membrane protein
MPVEFPGRIAAARRVRSWIVFFAPLIVGVILFSVVGRAQQFPNELQRQQQQRQDQSDTIADFGAQSQVLQPAVPQPSSYLLPSRLEQILSARAGVKLQQFGYDQFGRGRAVTIPQTGAVQDDYVLGPGDNVIVSLRGQENGLVNTMVDRNGQVLLPRLPPIAASGRNFGSFRQDLEAAIHRAYVGTDASVSIGRVRQISVLVSGEVNEPGQRLLTGLSSAVDALLLSGGVKKTGSLRNIRIQRGGHEFVVDFYSVLTGGGVGGGMRVADGDRIIVPPLGRTVAVTGLVRRPGIYELPARADSMTVRALLNLAGGQEVRGLYRLSVQHIEPDGRFNLVLLSGESGVVRDSEILRVELGADLAGTQATLSGGTGLAGQYAVTTGTRLSDVIRAPGALGISPYTLFGIIVRKDPRTLLRTLVAFTPVAVLNGSEDMPLLPDDIMRPITVDEAQLLTYIVKIDLAKMTLDQNSARGNAAPTMANRSDPNSPFGLDPATLDANSSDLGDFGNIPAELQRADIIALLDFAPPGTLLAQQRESAYQQSLLTPSGVTAPLGAMTDGQPPAQQPQVQGAALANAPQNNSPQYNAQQYNGSGGDLGDTSGQRPIMATGLPVQSNLNNANGSATPLAQNYQEQPARPGGYASNQEVHTFGELSRQLGVDPLVLVNFLIEHRARLDGAVRGPGSYFVGPNVSINDLVQAAGGTISWADDSGVELLTTVVDSHSGRAVTQRQTLPLRQGTLATYIIRPHDQLHFNKVFTDAGAGSITVQGEVRFAGDYPITRGEHLSDVLMRAGGLTSVAYPAGTVFLRKSAAQAEREGYQRAAAEIQSQALAGMARIGNDKITGDGFTAVQGFIAQLRTQKALGRIVITADPSVLAANPQLDPMLEAGDLVYVPQRPSTITVLGEVMQPGSYTYQSGMSVGEYIGKAGGYARFSDEDLTFIVHPDGSASKVERSWLGFDANSLPPGSTIVVPRDLAPLTARQIILDVTSIFSGLAVTAASLAVLAKQ